MACLEMVGGGIVVSVVVYTEERARAYALGEVVGREKLQYVVRLY